MLNKHPRLRNLLPRADLKQCNLSTGRLIEKNNLKPYIPRLIQCQHHSARSRSYPSTLNVGDSVIGVTPKRCDGNDINVQRPREDVDGARGKKVLLRIVDGIEEVVENTLSNLPTDFIARAVMRGGGDGALLPSLHFESAEWMRPGAEGAFGWAVARRVGKVGRPLRSCVHCIEANVETCLESVGEELRC